MCQSVCGMCCGGDRWRLSQLQWSQTVYPGGIAHRVCFDAEEHQKEIALPLARRLHTALPKSLPSSSPFLSFFPPRSRSSISYMKYNKHIPPFYSQTHFSKDKQHILLLVPVLSLTLVLSLTHTFFLSHTTDAV